MTNNKSYYLAIDATQPNLKLYLYQSNHLIKQLSTPLNRRLADQLIGKISSLIMLKDIDGIVLRDNTGSFTGIRIAGVFANTWHFYSGKPVISTNGSDWIESGIRRLDNATLIEGYIEPSYQKAPNITLSKRDEFKKDLTT